MKYMLDTNICIFVLRNKDNQAENVIKNIKAHKAEDICISSITYAELMHGVEKNVNPSKKRLGLMLFLSNISVLDFDQKAAEEYGKIRVALEKNRNVIGPMDILIAAHGKSLGMTIVTNNTREFERVEGLKVEDWSQE